MVEDYAKAARNAVSAGFDGVQPHGANGYLIDQFPRDAIYHRTDFYGPVPKNRVRLLKEIVDAVAAEVGAQKTSVRLSPNSGFAGVDDSDPQALFRSPPPSKRRALGSWKYAMRNEERPDEQRCPKHRPRILRCSRGRSS